MVVDSEQQGPPYKEGRERTLEDTGKRNGN